MNIPSKDLLFGDTVYFNGEYYTVVESVLNANHWYNVSLTPTDRLSLDVQYSFHPQDPFFVTDRL